MNLTHLTFYVNYGAPWEREKAFLQSATIRVRAGDRLIFDGPILYERTRLAEPLAGLDPSTVTVTLGMPPRMRRPRKLWAILHDVNAGSEVIETFTVERTNPGAWVPEERG